MSKMEEYKIVRLVAACCYTPTGRADTHAYTYMRAHFQHTHICARTRTHAGTYKVHAHAHMYSVKKNMQSFSNLQ